MPRISAEQRERNRLCRFPGCDQPWQTTFGSRIGPVCFKHQPSDKHEPLPAVPTTPPVKHWNDEKE